jgi:hypothetical protein
VIHLDALALDALVTTRPSWYIEHMTTHRIPDRIPQQVAALVEERLSATQERYAAEGRSLTDLGTAEDLADQMVALIPPPSAWDQAVGPFYSTSGIATLLGGVSRQAVADRRRRSTIFALQTTEGDWVYPTFQFDSHLSIYPALGSIRQRLPETSIDGWTLAGWLTTPHDGLEGSSIVEWIHQGGDADTVEALVAELADRSR